LEDDAVHDVLCDDPLIVPDGSVFEVLKTDEYNICYVPSDWPSDLPTEAPTKAPSSTPSASISARCNYFKSIREDESTTCDCQAEVDGTILNFIDECEYCNDDLTICVQYSFGQLYNKYGSTIDYMENFVYTKGRNEIVTLRKDFIDDSCQVFLEGQECESCTLNVCADGRYQFDSRPSFSCRNLEADAVYDLCDGPRIFSDGSVFEFWSTEGNEYLNGICYLPTEAPTEAPSSAPSPAISNVPSLPPTMTALPTEASSSTPSAAISNLPSLPPTMTSFSFS
jgi:hypothetical protein